MKTARGTDGKDEEEREAEQEVLAGAELFRKTISAHE
jgi:hypothetical protein